MSSLGTTRNVRSNGQELGRALAHPMDAEGCYERSKKLAQIPMREYGNTKRSAFTRGQIAVEVWDKAGSANRLNFLNAWQEYG